MFCSPIIESALPSLSVRTPGETNFSIIDNNSSRLTFEDLSNVRLFTYNGLMRNENASNFQCNVGMIGSNIITLLVYCKCCMHVNSVIRYVHLLYYTMS